MTTDTDELAVPAKLLPFPWIFATRKTARLLMRIIVVQHQVITSQQASIIRLQSKLNETGCTNDKGG